MRACLLPLAAALGLLAAPAFADEPVKIGLVTTLSGPAGVIGKHMKDAADLALDMLGGRSAASQRPLYLATTSSNLM